jgi:dihydrolipoamide dehydrogenase
MTATRFDLAVIGAGPGGYVAAIRASQLGMKTAIVEREHLGGICLNWGCIPTKALLRSSELFHTMRHAPDFGLAADNVRFDMARVVERSRKVAERLSNGVAYLMRKNKITVIDGTARLMGQGRIAVAGMRARRARRCPRSKRRTSSSRRGRARGPCRDFRPTAG